MKKRITTVIAALAIIATIGFPVKQEANAEDVVVTFTQPDTLELTQSTGNVDFGEVLGTVTSVSPDLLVNVKSSLNYDLKIKATTDFKNTTDVTSSDISVTKLGVKADGGTIEKFAGTETDLVIVGNATDTSDLVDVTRTHTLSFDLSETVGYRAGVYEVPLVVTLVQK